MGLVVSKFSLNRISLVFCPHPVRIVNLLGFERERATKNRERGILSQDSRCIKPQEKARPTRNGGRSPVERLVVISLEREDRATRNGGKFPVETVVVLSLEGKRENGDGERKIEVETVLYKDKRKEALRRNGESMNCINRIERNEKRGKDCFCKDEKGRKETKGRQYFKREIAQERKKGFFPNE